jgi:hypothetical protein
MYRRRPGGTFLEVLSEPPVGHRGGKFPPSEVSEASDLTCGEAKE